MSEVESRGEPGPAEIAYPCNLPRCRARFSPTEGEAGARTGARGVRRVRHRTARVAAAAGVPAVRRHAPGRRHRAAHDREAVPALGAGQRRGAPRPVRAADARAHVPRRAAPALGPRRADRLGAARPPEPPQGVDEALVLRAALARVPRRQQAVIVLRYLCDLPVEEVAGILGCSAGTVKSQCARGLATLRQLVGDDLQRTV
ncbi:MAG TPA: sigma-70 family RNA polymerase sigma factor [Dactylosporangium sp.]|nr:sigma-70 family RNA polymerase sigma factor [Dactylosporangium sp.]